MTAPLDALEDETARLATVLLGLTGPEWAAPTRCAPWDAAALTAHTTGAIARLASMLDADPPGEATVDAAGYYRPDQRFGPEVNDIRVKGPVETARIGGPALASAFIQARGDALARCRAAPEGRLVTTRHGDPMTLEDFLITRVVEACVHGIDLADALGRERWTGPAAAGLIVDLLLPGGKSDLDRLGWEEVAFIARATGRDEMSATERAEADAAGLTWLTLG